jgi:dienelactone hydrolase
MTAMKNTRKNTFKLILPALILFSLFLFPSNGFAYESSLKFKLKPGPYAVGFRMVNNYDYSRTYYSTYDITGKKVTEKARPIQTSIWYPADVEKAKNAPRMRMVDYALLMAQELGYIELTDAVKRETMTTFHLFFSTPAAKRAELEVVTRAVRDAEPAEGSFPLVIYGASINCVSFENSDLFEHLAGHGYIVVSSPCVGTTTRYLDANLVGTETQARDILFLLGYMKDFPGVDYSKIAVMGFSWGGMSNVLAAMRDTRIDAVICLDGSVAYNKYFDEFFTKSIYYNIDNITMPLLFLRSKKIPDEIMKKYGAEVQDSVKFYDRLKYSDAYFIRFHHLMHGDFCSTFLKFMDYKSSDNLESSRDETIRSYNLMSKYVHKFLDATIKGDSEALKFMSNTPRQNGDEGMVTKFSKKALKKAPTFGEFAFKVKNAGFDKIAAVYEEIKKEFPEYKLSEDRLIDLAYKMFAHQQAEEVFLLLKFTLTIHPKSHYAYYGLGELYAIKGDKEGAIKALEKCLELSPRYMKAQKKMEELKGKKSPAKK